MTLRPNTVDRIGCDCRKPRAGQAGRDGCRYVMAEMSGDGTAKSDVGLVALIERPEADIYKLGKFVFDKFGYEWMSIVAENVWGE